MMFNLKYSMSYGNNILFLIISLLFSYKGATAQKPVQWDYLIKGAWVFDGSGKDSVQTDIEVAGKKIVYIGYSAKDKFKSNKSIDATGLYLCPGFIGAHTHFDRNLSGETAEERMNVPCLSQGVTTAFVG